jgi:aminoglycoside phosphotransferase (APT) family kinase protein
VSLAEAPPTADVAAALPDALRGLLGVATEVVAVQRLGGGASKEAWSVDVLRDGVPDALLVRRMGGGVLHDHTVSLEVEHAVIAAAHAAGVPVPRPLGYIADLAGRDAFVMQRLQAEGIGRRIVTRDEFRKARNGLAAAMGRALAGIHRVDLALVPALPAQREDPPAATRVVAQLQKKLADADEPHPVIEAGLAWLRRHAASSCAAEPSPLVLVHGDFRVGNLLVDAAGLAAVIDWEFAHRGHALEDLAWPLVRAWRFGRDELHCGGVGTLDEYLAAYNAAAGTRFTRGHLFWWELAGNVRWAISCLTQARRHLGGAERNVELAVLGRLSCEVEMEIVHLLEEAQYAGQA